MYIRTYSDIMARRPVAHQLEPTEEDLVLDHYNGNNEQDGSGLISKFAGKIGNKLYPKWRPQPDGKGTEYEGKKEHHYPYHNFCGPQTFLRLRLERGDEPVDYPDKCAKEHDLEYQAISEKIKAGKLTEAQVKKLVRASDKKLMDCLKKDKNISSLIRSFIVRKIIHSKTKLEDLKIMSASSFVQPDAEPKPSVPIPIASLPSNPLARSLVNQVDITDPADAQTGGEYLMKKVADPDAPCYACCEACHKKRRFCEKKPAYKLKEKMFAKSQPKRKAKSSR
jgi:hypothetical protein